MDYTFFYELFILKRQDLTQEYLKDILNYNELTGIFTWKKRTHIRSTYIIGSNAGCLNKYGYLCITIHVKKYFAHRLAWLYVYGYFPEKEIDHINGIRNDNRICNLREANRNENQWNVTKRKDNSSGFKGVSWSKRENKWVANACLNKKQKHIGYFYQIEDAIKAYNDFTNKNHNNFYYNTTDILSERPSYS